MSDGLNLTPKITPLQPFSPSKSQKGLIGDDWLKYLPKDSAVIIDLGCGYNKLSPPRNGDKVIGLDHNELGDADIISNLDKFPYPFSDSTVDAIYSKHCIEHLAHRDEVFIEIHRILKAGGIAFVKVPHRTHTEAYNYDHRSFWYAGSMNTFANAKWYSSDYPYFEIIKIGLDWKGASQPNTLFRRIVNRILNLSFNLSEKWLWYPIGGIHEVQFLIRKP